MKLILLLVLASTMFCGGKERWDVKTLNDKLADSVIYVPQVKEVSEMVKLPGFQAKAHSPRQGIEFNTYMVFCTVVDYFKEADGDIHIVLADDSDSKITMIAEMPDTDCDQVRNSKYISIYDDVRDDFLSKPKKDMVGKHYVFVGVAFFDIKHPTPQRGVAPNLIELHPVLYFHEQESLPVELLKSTE